MKLVINECYGGFGLSSAARLWLWERGFDAEGFKLPIEKYYTNHAQREEVLARLDEGQSRPWETFTPDRKFVLNDLGDKDRGHPLLVECVETLGRLADGTCARLGVVEIPDGIAWEIDDYDGCETVREKHRSWS